MMTHAAACLGRRSAFQVELQERAVGSASEAGGLSPAPAIVVRQRAGNSSSSRGFAFVRSGKSGLDPLIDFFTMHGYVFGRVDADPDLLAADAQDGDRNVVTDVYAFTDFAGEYQHELLLDCVVGHLISDSADIGRMYRLVRSSTEWVPLF